MALCRCDDAVPQLEGSRGEQRGRLSLRVVGALRLQRRGLVGARGTLWWSEGLTMGLSIRTVQDRGASCPTAVVHWAATMGRCCDSGGAAGREALVQLRGSSNDRGPVGAGGYRGAGMRALVNSVLSALR